MSAINCRYAWPCLKLDRQAGCTMARMGGGAWRARTVGTYMYIIHRQKCSRFSDPITRVLRVLKNKHRIFPILYSMNTRSPICLNVLLFLLFLFLEGVDTDQGAHFKNIKQLKNEKNFIWTDRKQVKFCFHLPIGPNRIVRLFFKSAPRVVLRNQCKNNFTAQRKS